MQTHITPNNKLASFGTIGLLFLAGIAGMVFLLPLNSAHAASPAVTLSTITSGVETAAIGEFHDVRDTDMVIGVVIGTQSRAYPVRYLAHHHMLNDRLGPVALLPTY